MTVESQTASEIPTSTPPVGARFRWLGDLAISILVALPYAISLLDRIIRPGNIAWLAGDPATHYVAWAMFRLSSGLHWPLTYTAALGYPIGESISLLDGTPLVALLLRPFSSLLPTPFQYLGLYSVLCLILQLFFAVRLLRAILPDRRFVAWLGGVFFLIAPPLTFRFTGHYSLASHWVILAALLLYARIVSGAYSVRGTIWRVATLTVVAVGINPYIAAMAVSVLLAACVAAVVNRQMSRRTALRALATIGVCFVVTASAFGLIGSTNEDFTAGGYRIYSMNLLSPIDPARSGSPFMPTQHTFTFGQYEGYNYLGAGTLALLLLALFVTLTGRIEITKNDLLKWTPLALCGIFFAVLSLSTLVSLGDHALFDWDPGQHLTPYLSMFRASGRLFWLLYYLITAYVLISAIRFLKPRDGVVILLAALALQIYDTSSLRRDTSGLLASYTLPQNLHSPVWRTLNREHSNLAVLPAWQCGGETPGGGDGFRIFGLLAAEQGLTINSYYAARYHRDTLTYHCKTSIEQLSNDALSPHTAYVVSPQLARIINRGKTGPGHCYSVDGFVLCSTSAISGAGPWPGPVPLLPLGASDLQIKDEAYFLTGWTSLEAGFGSWSMDPEAVFAYHTPPVPAKSLRLRLMAVNGKNPVVFTVVSENGRFEGTLPPSKPSVIQFFTIRLPIATGQGIHEVSILTKQLQSPADQGFNSDARKLGVGVHSLAADACPPSSAIDYRPIDDPTCVIK